VGVVRIAIVGTISNAERDLESNLRRLVKACSDFEITAIYLVESDSKDRTVKVLENLSKELNNFRFVSLGELKKEIPDRISRIRFCRNRYVEEIRIWDKEVEYVVVADLDGMNSRITRAGFNSTFKRSDWSAVLANQSGGYYDLLALRHQEWCPHDILVELKQEQEKIDISHIGFFSFPKKFRRRLEFDQARKRAIYSKMRQIEKSSDWIEVLSGFGGLGIYRSELFQNFDYSLQAADFPNESEHVAFSRKIVQSGGKLFINPRMINNFYNTYNVNRFFIIRQIREIYWNLGKHLRKLIQGR
jgi:hypothetical protein